jgi:hypothetical protein
VNDLIDANVGRFRRDHRDKWYGGHVVQELPAGDDFHARHRMSARSTRPS